MALEVSEPDSISALASPELARFAADTQTTLLSLERVLREKSFASTGTPDLRHNFHALLESGDPKAQPHILQTVEGDAIVNSLDTLRDQILKWREQGKEANPVSKDM
ncbi:hypothetical protein JAO29_14625 [Edaphobacter sp. HDX4]|uniref:hypothetical protein n=1 Tax=Edaphobacter sp. HDX4 TaxID=2794064 RepID=UPI002FE62382